MNKLTYKEAYDKIIDAYFKDEIKPLNPEFCFCGTLCNNTTKWYGSCMASHRASHGYLGADFVRMERALLAYTNKDGYILEEVNELDEIYEDILFDAMSAALDVLKEIHRSRGENVDEEIPVFTKRNDPKVDTVKDNQDFKPVREIVNN